MGWCTWDSNPGSTGWKAQTNTLSLSLHLNALSTALNEFGPNKIAPDE